jgi:hypothetical protein
MSQHIPRNAIPLTKNTKFVYKAPSGQLIGPLVIAEILERNNFLVYLEVLPQLCGVVHLPDGTELYPSFIHSTPGKKQKLETHPTVDLTTTDPDEGITTATAIIPTVRPETTAIPASERPQSATSPQTNLNRLFSSGGLAFLE